MITSVTNSRTRVALYTLKSKDNSKGVRVTGITQKVRGRAELYGSGDLTKTQVTSTTRVTQRNTRHQECCTRMSKLFFLE